MSPISVDAGAWFARFVPPDIDHLAAREWFDQNAHPRVTTDHVVDELLTLLKMRGEYQRDLEIGSAMFEGDVCDLAWDTRADY
jgi:predicted nucleic acid-binding protein